MSKMIRIGAVLACAILVGIIVWHAVIPGQQEAAPTKSSTSRARAGAVTSGNATHEAERPSEADPRTKFPSVASAPSRNAIRPSIQQPGPGPDIHSFAENLRRADAATGLSGEELEKFHSAFIRGLQRYGPLGHFDDARDSMNEVRARYATVAEELLGPDKAQAYVDELLAVSKERGQRYTEEVQKGKGPVEAARAAGYDIPDEAADASPVKP